MQAGRVQFPPLRELPPGVTIEKLPLVGTTWYRRGAWYWTRRAGAACLMLLPAGVAAGIAWPALGSIRRASPLAFDITLAAELVTSLTLISGLCVLTARRRSRPGWWRAPQQRRLARGVRAVAAGLAGLILGLVLVLVLGFWAALAACYLLPTVPGERAARLRLADQLSDRAGQAPG